MSLLIVYQRTYPRGEPHCKRPDFSRLHKSALQKTLALGCCVRVGEMRQQDQEEVQKKFLSINEIDDDCSHICFSGRIQSKLQ